MGRGNKVLHPTAEKMPALFAAMLLLPGYAHFHRQAVDLGDEDLRLAHP
jgi:hypothetical protein